MISVCIATRERPDQLAECLDSLARQDGAPDFEVLVCANGDPGVADTVETWFPDGRLWLIDRAHPGAARNILIDNATGDVLLFLDDDVIVHSRLLHRLGSAVAAYPDVMVFGGPNLTPPGSSRFQSLQGAVLASLVGTGPVRRRYGRHAVGSADERYFTLCNLAVRREAMTHFDLELVCAEENAMLIELSDHKMQMRYDPTLHVFHERRPTPKSFLGQAFKYGRGRGQIVARRPTSLRPSFAAPAILVVYLATLPALLLAHPLWLSPLGLYIAVVLAGAVKIALTVRKPGTFVPAGTLIVLLHLFYGTGVLMGLLGPKREFRQDDRPTRGTSGAAQGGEAVERR